MISGRFVDSAVRVVRVCLLVAALAAPAPAALAAVEDVGFFGVKFGMTAAEVGTHWNRLGEGAYSVPALGIQEVQALFDHQGRLYDFSFTLTPPDSKVPAPIQMRAIQQAVESRWGKGNPAFEVSMSSGRDSTRIRVTHRKLLDGYVSFVQETIEAIFKP